MVLEDVAQRSRLLVERPAVLDTEVLRHGDLHMVDVAAIPDRLEDRVGEPKGEDVLDRLLRQVVVDAVDLVLAEVEVELGVELTRALQVAAEGLLDDDPAELPFRLFRQPGASNAGGDVREHLRNRRQVVEDVAGGPMLRVAFIEHFTEPPERVVVVEGAGDVAVLHAPLVESVLSPFGLAVARLCDRVPHLSREVLVAHPGSGDADDGQAARQLSASRQ